MKLRSRCNILANVLVKFVFSPCLNNVTPNLASITLQKSEDDSLADRSASATLLSLVSVHVPLDKTGGRESEAWEAYRIPPDDPNVRQDVGVRPASLYARRLLRHAVDLNRTIVLSNINTPVIASE
jgi:hypothetical protein